MIEMSARAEARAARRQLGLALKVAREAAGFSQVRLGRVTGYSRSTVSTVESGGQNVPRAFWACCDEALGTGAALTAGYDRLGRARIVASLAEPPVVGVAADDDDTDAGLAPGLAANTPAEAVAAYRALGWRPEAADGRVELVCGTSVEALEVSRAVGMIALRWWLHTGGAPDEIRGLPGLPGPRDALAVVAARDRWFFLVQAGACPWAYPDRPAGAARAPGAAPWSAPAAVRWHAAGSRIPVPPSPEPGQVLWAYPPPARPRLADPVILLDLLGRAAALASGHPRLLTLPGGVTVGLAPAPAASPQARPLSA
jgi:transcriptional regulator with XRE-family HTH domain